jgi:hypothetical protein
VSQNSVEIVVKARDQTKAGFDATERNAHRLKSTLKDVGTTAAGVLSADMAQRAGAAFGRFVGDTVRQATNLTESINAVNVVFGNSAKVVQDWGQQNAASFGLSRAEFNKLATPLGAMLKNAGLSMQDTSKWTVDLTKRASDMASVFNTDVGEALTAIQAGLRGESDPLERFGVGLSAAAVEAKALADTGKSAANSLTNQEKATARLGLIMEQTSSVQGDFANTADGAANAARIATAQFDNAKASLGQALLPILAKAATAAAALAGGFAGLPGPVQAAIVVAGTFGAAVTVLGPKLASARTQLASLQAQAAASGVSFGGITKGVGAAAGALGAMQVASAAFGDSATVGVNTASQALKDYASGADMASSVTKDLGFDLSALNDEAWYDKAVLSTIKMTEAISGVGSVLDSSVQHSVERLGALDGALANLVSSGNAGAAAKAYARITEEAAAQGVSTERLKEAFPGYTDALVAAKNANTATAGAAKDLTAELEEQNESAEKAANNLLGQRGALRNLEAAYDGATAAAQENGATLNDGTEKGRANAEALDQIASAAGSAAGALEKAAVPQEEINATLAVARTRYIATAVAMGMPIGQARRLAAQLIAIPKTVTTKVTTNTTQARNTLYALDSLITRVTRGRVIPVYASAPNVRESRASGGIVGHADGGGPRSGSVLVGESGPEIVDLPPGARVHSNPDSQRILSPTGSGMGNNSAPLVIMLQIGDRPLGELIVDPLRKIVRARGGDVQAVLSG